MRLLQQGAHELREVLTGGRLDRTGRDELTRLVERLERVITRVGDIEGSSEFDPVARLRRQIGARTVSRLREICDEPIPVWGEDLRIVAQGA
jgi:hypothetical protein